MVVGEIGLRGHAHGRAGLGHQAPQALGVGQGVVVEIARHRALGQVVHPLPAAPPHAHHVAEHQRPLDRDLGVAPVPPGAAVLRAAEVGGGQRALGAQLVEHPVIGAARQLVMPLVARAVGAAAEREQRPLLDRQHAGGVRPVLERVVPRPVRLLHRRPADRAEPGVGQQLVGAGEHGDGVQLDRAEAAQHAPHPGPAVRGPEQSLGAQGDPACLVGGEWQNGGSHARDRRADH